MLYFILLDTGVLREMRISCTGYKQESETLGANQHMMVTYFPNSYQFLTALSIEKFHKVVPYQKIWVFYE